MAVYLKISVSDFLTVFAARTRGPFWSRAPGTLLFAAALVATVASTIIALSWPDGAGASSEDVDATTDRATTDRAAARDRPPPKQR